MMLCIRATNTAIYALFQAKKNLDKRDVIKNVEKLSIIDSYDRSAGQISFVA
jgi:hypothetical protein